MLGAIIGDIVGSRFEFHNTKNYDFELFHKDCSFTDDTICTVAIADTILSGGIEYLPQERNYRLDLQYWCKKYPIPMGAYGANFSNWIHSSSPEPYGSYGNGAAMRVSPIGWAFANEDIVLRQAMMSAKVSHDHVEGMLGAAAVAVVINNLRFSKEKELLNLTACKFYGAEWESLIPRKGVWNETCQGCVPLAFKIVMQSDNFEDAIRRAVCYGGDSDTVGAIVGSIAEPLFGIPQEMIDKAYRYLTLDLRNVVDKFIDTYGK